MAIAKELSAAYSRSDYPFVNSIINAFNTHTGDDQALDLAAQLHGVADSTAILWKIALVTVVCQLCFYYNDLYDLTVVQSSQELVVRLRPDGGGEILADEVMSQIAAHAPFGGVVPEIAARAHVEIIDLLIAGALKRAKMAAKDLDGVAAAAGPGLIGGVLVGLMAGKGVALACGKPFVAVNHLEAHALTARLTDSVAFPFLVLLASGGHTQILAVKGVGDYVRLGATKGEEQRWMTSGSATRGSRSRASPWG